MSRPARLLIRGGYVIDGTGADPQRDCSLLIEDGRIVAVRPGGDLRAPAGTRSVDVEGRSVIPGLFNCHVHLELDAGPAPLAALATEPSGLTLLRAAQRARAMLRHGITTVRDCGAKDWHVIHLRDAIAGGVVQGPRIQACGRALCAVGGHAAVIAEPVAGEAEMAAAALRQLEAGADFLKVMGTGGFGKDGEQLDRCELDVEPIRVATAIAHRAGRKATVHAYGNQGIRNAIAAGADSIEHATFVDDETLDALRRRNVFIVPTLTNTYRVATEGEQGGVAPYIVKTASQALPIMMANAARAYRARVKMALGTDAGSWLNPHTDVATEIQLRVESGATPLAALTMATAASAECLGLQALLGSLEPGKIADVVILDGDPLADLTAYRRVHAVYRGGVPIELDGERSS